MELVPDAPQEAIKTRDEFLKWREEKTINHLIIKCDV